MYTLYKTVKCSMVNFCGCRSVAPSSIISKELVWKIRLTSPKLAQVFVHRKMQPFFFDTYGPVAPRSSVHFFFTPGATDLQAGLLKKMLLIDFLTFRH